MQPDPQAQAAGANTGGLIDRVKSILTSPRSEWPVIGSEPATVAGLYTGYFMILAAIPAAFGFIKGSLIGYGGFGVTVTTPILAGLISMVIGYVLGLVVLYLMALIVNALAPTFGGQKNQVQALKAVGYAWTAAWVAGIAVIVPWIGWLVGLAGAIYSIYLLYLGLPHTMKNPPEKSLAYTVVTAIIAIVLSVIMGAILAGVAGVGALTMGALGGSSSSNVRVDGDSRLGRIASFGKLMEAAGRDGGKEQAGDAPEATDEAALAALLGALGGAADEEESAGSAGAGNDASAAEALGALFGAATGAGGADGKPGAAVAPEQLRELLPGSLGGLRRTSLSANRQGSMGMEISEAGADYESEDGEIRIRVEIQDVAAMSGLVAMASAFGNIEESKETDSGFERTYSRGGKVFSEKWNHHSGQGEYSVLLDSRFSIEATGRVGNIDQLKGVVEYLEPQVARLQ